MDACASLPASSARVIEQLRSIGGDVDVLQAMWPQLEGMLQASDMPAGSEQREQRQGQEREAQQQQWSTYTSARALCETVASALPEFELPAKRQRMTAPYSGGLTRWRHADKLPAVVEAVRAAAPQLQIELMNSFNNTRSHYPRGADEVRLLCPGVFCAAVVLSGGGRAEPVRVVVDSADMAADVLGWSTSCHQCFQRISALAARAAAYFLRTAAAKELLSLAPAEARKGGASGGGGGGGGDGTGGGGPEALECLLLWLACYSDLFSRPCTATGKLLCWEPGSAVPLPPIVRPFKLSRDQLAAAAMDPSLRRAYHAHAAPREELLLQPAAPRRPGPGWSGPGGDEELERLL